MIARLLYESGRLLLCQVGLYLVGLCLLGWLLIIYLHVFWQYLGAFSTTLAAAGLLLLGRLLTIAALTRAAPPANWLLRPLHLLLLILSCGCAWLYFGEHLTRPWSGTPYWHNHLSIEALLPAPHPAWSPSFHGLLMNGTGFETVPDRRQDVEQTVDTDLRFDHAPVDLLRIRLWRSFGIDADRAWLSAGLALVLALVLELGSNLVLRRALHTLILWLYAENDYHRILSRKRLETALTLRSERIETAALQRRIRDERVRLEREIRRAAGLDD